MNGQDEDLSDVPAAIGQVNGESDTIAARAGVEVRQTRRPIPAEPVEQPPDPERKVEEERREAALLDEIQPVTEDPGEEEARPDAEPTGGEEARSDAELRAGEEARSGAEPTG
ncbi:hypothetical protein [Nonomuraea zeae]|uniref:Uncharacterized protein n=1 Tax=Nonomuraea zeae TaxID=1642303 RepID=A0A5S4GZX6_9ACTN|nr:hypothetical protein [Nonomuraea zeae]TMR38533.1 hypothetical protein ETD85_04150 [Nonomuraea zeae]